MIKITYKSEDRFLKKIGVLCCAIFASVSHAESIIQLDQIATINQPECQTTAGMYATDNLTEFEKTKLFSMSDEDGLIITLYSKQKTPCFSFSFIPEQSPQMNLEIKRNQLTILEMYGSTLNGNWLKSVYKIDLKRKKLNKISSQFISFSTDENGQSHANISDWE